MQEGPRRAADGCRPSCGAGRVERPRSLLGYACPGRPPMRGAAGAPGLLAVAASASTPCALGWRSRRGQARTCRGQSQVLPNRAHLSGLLHVRQHPPPASTPDAGEARLARMSCAAVPRKSPGGVLSFFGSCVPPASGATLASCAPPLVRVCRVARMSQEPAEWPGTGRDSRGCGGITTPKHCGRLRGKGTILLGVSHRPARVRFPPPPPSTRAGAPAWPWRPCRAPRCPG